MKIYLSHFKPLCKPKDSLLNIDLTAMQLFTLGMSNLAQKIITLNKLTQTGYKQNHGSGKCEYD